MLKRAQRMKLKQQQQKKKGGLVCIILHYLSTLFFEKLRGMKLMRAYMARSSIQRRTMGTRSPFPEGKVSTLISGSFHSGLCSFKCASTALNLSTLCMLMSHNRQQKPGPVVSDWALLRPCRGNNACQETSRQAIP